MSLCMHYYFSILLLTYVLFKSKKKKKKLVKCEPSFNASATSPFVFAEKKWEDSWLYAHASISAMCFFLIPKLQSNPKYQQNNSKLISQREHSSGEFADLFYSNHQQHLQPSPPWRATLKQTRPSRSMSVKQVPGADESNAPRRGSKVTIAIETVPRHVVSCPSSHKLDIIQKGTVSGSVTQRKSSLSSAASYTTIELVPHDEQ